MDSKGRSDIPTRICGHFKPPPPTRCTQREHASGSRCTGRRLPGAEADPHADARDQAHDDGELVLLHVNPVLGLDFSPIATRYGFTDAELVAQEPPPPDPPPPALALSLLKPPVPARSGPDRLGEASPSRAPTPAIPRHWQPSRVPHGSDRRTRGPPPAATPRAGPPARGDSPSRPAGAPSAGRSRSQSAESRQGRAFRRASDNSYRRSPPRNHTGLDAHAMVHAVDAGLVREISWL